MAKEEAAPKAPKPRLRHIRELMIIEPIHLKRGPTNHFLRSTEMSITADLDGQYFTLRPSGDKSYCIPFCRAKYWQVDVGTVSTK